MVFQCKIEQEQRVDWRHFVATVRQLAAATFNVVWCTVRSDVILQQFRCADHMKQFRELSRQKVLHTFHNGAQKERNLKYDDTTDDRWRILCESVQCEQQK